MSFIDLYRLAMLRHYTHKSKTNFVGLSFNFRNDKTLVTQPMLQPTSNQTEIRLMVSKSIFSVDSKNVSKKFLHRRYSQVSIKRAVYIKQAGWNIFKK